MAVEIGPGQEDAILQVASYHCHDYDLAVIRSAPHEHIPIRTSIAQPFPTSPLSSLGALSAFPVEIVAVICLSMDVTSVFRFRQVNRLARNIASSPLPYQPCHRGLPLRSFR